jgi:hypothetical protein
VWNVNGVMTIKAFLFFIFTFSFGTVVSQPSFPHPHGHAHNDYEHARPLFDALRFGFTSVEADVHLVDGQLLVSHNMPKRDAPTFQSLYLDPLDSLLKANDGKIYPHFAGTFYLMIDFKTEAEATGRALLNVIKNFPALRCEKHCPVKLFISGHRPINLFINEGFQGLALDGRPYDLGKGFSAEQMPVISDPFSNWCTWKADGPPPADEMNRIRELVARIHAEGKKLRLWAIPDNVKMWDALLNAGVDLINTDRLEELHVFLSNRGR